jgi:hypothetical protein
MAQKTIKNPKRETVKFSVDLKNGKVAQYELHVPNFSEKHQAFIEMTTSSGKIDMIGAGKVIWNLCCVQYDEILDNSEYEDALMAIMLSLTNEFVSNFSYEIKKN